MPERQHNVRLWMVFAFTAAGSVAAGTVVITQAFERAEVAIAQVSVLKDRIDKLENEQRAQRDVLIYTGMIRVGLPKKRK